MAANGYSTPLQDLARALIAEVKSLTVVQLKDLLRYQGLTVSGVKSELQIRIIAGEYLHALDSQRDFRVTLVTYSRHRNRESTECGQPHRARDSSKTFERRPVCNAGSVISILPNAHPNLISLATVCPIEFAIHYGWWPGPLQAIGGRRT